MPKFFSIVSAFLKNSRGIGYKKSLPWPNIAEDMENFKKLTSQTLNKSKTNAIIVGRKTWNSYKNITLPNRYNIVISQKLYKNTVYNRKVRILNDLNQALSICDDPNIENVFVIGGQQVYESAIQHQRCQKLYLTEIEMENEPTCDKYFPNIPHHFKLINTQIVKTKNTNLKFLTYENYTNPQSEENQYLHLVNNILQNGQYVEGRNGCVKTIFGPQHTFDLKHGFPLITTKKMFYKGVITELLMFLRGETNTNILSQQGNRIWEGNTTREFLDNRGLNHYKVGDMGPMYGFQLRHFGAKYINMYHNYDGEGYDQLRELLDNITKDPSSRRLLLTMYNPTEVKNSALAPCHGLSIQFNIINGVLDCKVYQRSADIGLGYPFNIASYATFMYIICHVTGLTPGKLIMSLGNTHIYEEHIELIKSQIQRTPYKFPQLNITKPFKVEDSSVSDKLAYIDDLTGSDFSVDNYHHHSKINMPMIA